MSGIGWLHLSDFHQGQQGQDWIWPNVRERLYADLARMHAASGPWDVVFFTGDITQRGTPAEFGRVSDTLGHLWQYLATLGSRPSLVTVPGNHDLVRPNPRKAAVLMLEQWEKAPGLLREFWEDQGCEYRDVVLQAFQAYTDWSSSHFLPRNPVRLGVLPGDFSSTFDIGGVLLGVVGLNTAFLQLTGGDYEGRLDLDVSQFHVACGADGASWAQEHDICLLMTHHPPSWLSSRGLRTLRGEIAPPGRFVAHLFGHMHEAHSAELAVAGGAPWRSWQSPSLFGLESWGEAREERSHGYTSGRIEVIDGKAVIRRWPRLGIRRKEGHWDIVPNHSAFELVDDATKPIDLVLNKRPVVPPPHARAATSAGASTSSQPPSPQAPFAPRNLDKLVDQLLGTDPILGEVARRELSAAGGAGEMAMLARALRYPRPIQARRRLLKYVASRGESIIEPLLKKLREAEAYGDIRATGFLFAAFPEKNQILQPLTEMIKAAPAESVGALFEVWGHAAGEASFLLSQVNKSSYGWEKLRGAAFQGACASVARSGRGFHALAQFVTHMFRHGFEEIPNEESVPNYALGGQEIWFQAYYTFPVWAQGVVADEVLRAWSVHEHWRVRSFGAQVLSSFGFSRTTTPIVDWLQREPVASVRASLLEALERAATAHASDALMEHFESSGEGKGAFARAAFRTTQTEKAIGLLATIANDDDAQSADALYSLARLGVQHPALAARLDGKFYYTRLVAGVAAAYLGDSASSTRLAAMLREAGHSHERVFLTAGLALLGNVAPSQLHATLVDAGAAEEFNELFDLYQFRRFLQDTVIDGLEAGGPEGIAMAEAWRRELVPLEPVPAGLA